MLSRCSYASIVCKALLTTVLLGSPLCELAQKPTNRGVIDSTQKVPTVEGAGKYYALVIGISGYQHLPHLVTPINDAKELAVVLGDEYGFDTEVLLDPTRDQIIEALDRKRKTLNETDSLLIYYAGHGYFDKDVDQAYWAPVDAGQDTYAHWIIATEITGTAKAIPARHVLVISDSCYSGMLTRDATMGAYPDLSEGDRYLAKMLQTKSRTVMSSGGNEPVADSDAPGHFSNHSVFANALLQNLSQPPAMEFTGEQLFVDLKQQVAGRSQQVPEYNPIRDSLHDGGDFIFIHVRKGAVEEGDAAIHAVTKEPEIKAPDRAEEGVRAALDSYEDAYESMDTHEIKKIWPSLSKDQEKDLKAGFQAPGLNAVKVELRNRTPRISGDTAIVDCDQWLIYTFSGRRQPPRTNSIEILLAKDSQGQWAINSVKGR